MGNQKLLDPVVAVSGAIATATVMQILVVETLASDTKKACGKKKAPQGLR